jgi:hypothetical protein
MGGKQKHEQAVLVALAPIQLPSPAAQVFWHELRDGL